MAGEPTALLKVSILRSYLLMNMSLDPESVLKLFISHNKQTRPCEHQENWRRTKPVAIRRHFHTFIFWKHVMNQG